MRYNNRAVTDQQILTTLVAVDNNTSGFIKDTEGWRMLAASAVAIPNTGDTNENILATVPIPAGAMGPNGILRITSLWSCTANNANVKTPRVRLGGIGGTVYMASPITSSLGGYFQRCIHNRNSQSSQCGTLGVTTTNSFTTTSAAIVTSSVDTSVAVDLVFTAQLATGSDSMSLEQYMVELKYGA